MAGVRNEEARNGDPAAWNRFERNHGMNDDASHPVSHTQYICQELTVEGDSGRQRSATRLPESDGRATQRLTTNGELGGGRDYCPRPTSASIAAMATHRHVRGHFKREGVTEAQHHPHHQQQGLLPSHHLHHPRPPSVVQQQAQQPPPPQQHHHQGHAQPQAQPPQARHHQTAYSSAHSLPQIYQPGGNQGTASQDSSLGYYNHPSPYSTPGANSGYTYADTSDMMAAAQMPRPPYPPMSYHTPHSNSPASVSSPSQHDQHGSIYGQPPSQHLQQSMYYQAQPHYQPLPPHPAASPYAQHAHHQQSMTSQPNMMLSHAAPQNPMTQHAAQHAQAGMMGSPRPKMEPQVPVQLQKQPPQSSPIPQAQHQQAAAPLQSPGNPSAGINPNAAPGPIPATTPLVVRQDGNGVQWIAFEYSRDRVKMEYTIRCDVESVMTEELSPEFKQENCVYPRACCPKDQYRGNRLMYETDCNRVGWALAQLNPPLRGKRGLIQRAVDSWRNSNQDPRLRSRRVRRMTKINNRKHVQGTPTLHPGVTHMPGPGASSGMPGAPSMGKAGLGSMGQPMHHHAGGHHDGGAPGGGDDVGPGHTYEDHQHHHQASSAPGHPGGGDVRQVHVFTGYGGQGYPSNTAQGGPMSHMAPRAGGAVPARSHSRSHVDEPDGLFPDIPEAKKRKFILVEDDVSGSRLRVRVTLDGVDTKKSRTASAKEPVFTHAATFQERCRARLRARRGLSSSAMTCRMMASRRLRGEK